MSRLRSSWPRRWPSSGPSVALLASPQGAEELAHVADQQVGDLHGGEVAATVELRPVDDGVGPFGEAPDREGDLAREDRHAGGGHRRLLRRAPAAAVRG